LLENIMENIPAADDLDSFLSILPKELRLKIEEETAGLYEVVMDLGRLPEARYLDKHSVFLSDRLVSQADIDAAISAIGQFSGDNRAGIERTLHRISCIRNRSERIIGLTCRV